MSPIEQDRALRSRAERREALRETLAACQSGGARINLSRSSRYTRNSVRLTHIENRLSTSDNHRTQCWFAGCGIE